MIVKTKINKKTTFTRMCITEAIIDLLDTIEFDKLKISQIIHRAGISRMTFYKYYRTPYEALTDYLTIIVSEYMEQNKERNERRKYLEYDHILFSLLFFDQYAKYFLTLAKHNLQGILLDGVNIFMAEYIRPYKELSYYEMYFYAGGLLNCFLKWEENGKVDSAEDIASIVCKLNKDVPGGR